MATDIKVLAERAVRPVDNAVLSRLARLKATPRSPGEASFFFRDQQFQYDSVKVLPGEYYVSLEDMMITTVLGSCIAACIWDSKARAGGMNHFMLPEGDSNDGGGRYGSYAMELLINQLLKAGARRESMQAKIFGGAQVMAGFTSMNVGRAQYTVCSGVSGDRKNPGGVPGCA
jgi:chemotaxis protein CheD